MSVKIKKMSDTREKFKNALLDIHEDTAKDIVKQYKERTHKELNLTKLYARTSPMRGFFYARPKTVSTIKKEANGVKIKARTYMADPSNQPHEIWHYVNGGTRDRIVKPGKGFLIRFPNYNRTTPNTLKSKPYGGLSGNTFWARPGTKISGITARNFYAKVLQRLNTSFYRRKLVKQLSGLKKGYTNYE